MEGEGVYLTKHEDMNFESQTIMLSGNAYLNCTFSSCTLIFTNVGFVLNGCRFENCNWHMNYLLMWGDGSARAALRQLLDLMDGGGAISFSAN